MRKGDFFWVLGLLAIAAFLIAPKTNEFFIASTKSHPYILGFIKFAILATMGDLLSIRIVKGRYEKPIGLLPKMLIWGVIGIITAVYFPIFSSGVESMQSNGLLFGANSALATAFLTSLTMNVVVGPFVMTFHNFSDTYIELRHIHLGSDVESVINAIHFQRVFRFLIFKTIPLFWIPVHTITFLLPQEYRVLMAAALSIVLGVILGFSKRKK